MSSSVSREEIANKEEEGQNGVSANIEDKKRKHQGSSSGETPEFFLQRRLEFSEEYEKGETVMDIAGDNAGNSENMAGQRGQKGRQTDWQMV